MRTGKYSRKTTETDIALSINLDGAGNFSGSTGIGFFDHMLELFSRHGRFDLDVRCSGDTHVDNHHSVEDIAICLGTAFAHALGDARGICRYGDVALPMDETLVQCAVDISGRSYLVFDVDFAAHSVGVMDTELLEEFFIAFTRNAGITIHIKKLYGKNMHHIFEACFKALARTLRKALTIDDAFSNDIPSTKGVLT